jgi:hypothetical protein
LSDVSVSSSPKCPTHSRLITWNAKGTAGTAGTSGTRGSLWNAGSVPPVVAVGQLDGDLYLDTSTGDVYEFISGAWTTEGSVRGPQGTAGPAGAIGQTGPAGTPGSNAADSESCTTGQSVTGFDSSGHIICGSPATLMMQNNEYSTCGGNCWGSFSGSGLESGAPYNIYTSTGLLGSGAVSVDGTVGGSLGLVCNEGWEGVYVISKTAAGVSITSNVENSPCG